MKILQANLNGKAVLTDLLLQCMRELRVSLAVISEPHSIPDDPSWAASADRLAVLTWRGSVRNLDYVIVINGVGFCVVSWGDCYVCSCYFSPRGRRDSFIQWLNCLGMALAPFLDSPMFVLGDFNARSLVWDSGGFNERGDILADWMAGLGLFLLNCGWTPTTFHPRGVSVVDTSWANSLALSKVGAWSV